MSCKSKNVTDIFVKEQSTTLPLMRYPRSIPKRYEETRSPIIQDFTHQRIICYGSEIQKKVKHQEEEEKQLVVHQSERDVWQQAEIVKNSELKKLREQLKAEHEKVIKKIEKEKEQALKEEALRVEMQMQKHAIQQVKEERAKGEEALAKAVKHAEEVAAKELREACSAVRSHERSVAEIFITNLVEKQIKDMVQVKKAASEDKKIALLNAQEIKQCEIEAAVSDARRDERENGEKHLEECKQYYVSEVEKMEEKLSQKEEEIKELLKEIEKRDFLKSAIEKHLLEMRVEYQEYIERTSCLDRELTDMLMPPLYLEDIEKQALAEYETLQNTEIADQQEEFNESDAA